MKKLLYLICIAAIIYWVLKGYYVYVVVGVASVFVVTFLENIIHFIAILVIALVAVLFYGMYLEYEEG